MSKTYRNVCEIIVPNNLCIGCGLCAGVCPPQVLTMQLNMEGEYIPIEYKDGCLPKCDLCLRACPFTNQEDNEDTLAATNYAQLTGIQHSKVIGYYLDTYVGYSQIENQRENGASGGMATWFLETLLKRGIADKVVCVTPYHDNRQSLFRYAILDSTEAVRNASRSCYYPVEMSEVIGEIIGDEARYAIIGLPCFLKGLRLSMRKNRRLRQRLVALAGLVCGQMKSRFFAEYLSAACGGHLENLSKVQFRIKDTNRPASDYGHQFTWINNGVESTRKIFWSEGIEDIWTHDYFKPNACNFCDDIFAETADVVFMDAWLPQYKQDYRGHSLIINRQIKFKEIWSEALNSNEVYLEPTDPTAVIRSQEGVLHQKRTVLQYRLHLAKISGQMVPRKRVLPSTRLSFMDRRLTKLKLQIQTKSTSRWSQKKDPVQLRTILWMVDTQINLIRLITRMRKTINDGRLRSAIFKRLNR
jgi:coenzyme F420 hydrogenase subunit beta